MNTAGSQVVLIPLDLIEVGSRLRPVDEDYAALIAESFRQRGQDTPIRVTEADPETGRHRLIAGAHRLAAARIAGWTRIAALPFSGSELEAELLQIDENLVRRELSDLDRAVFLARRKEIHEALHPATRHGGDRRSDQVRASANLIGLGETFAEVTAKKLGLHPNTVRKYVARASRIVPDVRDRIATTWVADKGTELDALAKLGPADQRKVVEVLLRAEAPAASVAAALREIRGVVEDPPEAADLQYAALLSAWRKAGKRARKLFVNYLVQSGAVDAARGGEGA